MKKIYLCMMAVMLGVSTQARELKFFIGDTEITDGQTISFTDISLVDAGGYYELTMAPDLSITTDIFTPNLAITATCTSGQKIQMCCGGDCMIGTTVEKKGLKLSPGAKLPLQFEYIAELELDEEVPMVTTTFEAQDGNYTATHKSFTLVMSQNASLTLIENNDRLYTTPGTIQYALDTEAKFTLYNIDGLQVLSASLHGHGSLSTAGLPAGIYVYTLGDQSGKLVIR